MLLFLRPSEEEVADVNTSKKDQEGFKTKGPQLSRKNSSKNLVSNILLNAYGILLIVNI